VLGAVLDETFHSKSFNYTKNHESNSPSLEQTVLLASVVHRFEWALPSQDWEPERYESFNLSPGPMPLKVWRRFEDLD
jgi:hypothetical protein